MYSIADALDIMLSHCFESFSLVSNVAEQILSTQALISQKADFFNSYNLLDFIDVAIEYASVDSH